MWEKGCLIWSKKENQNKTKKIKNTQKDINGIY